MNKLEQGMPPDLAGSISEYSNGNGSLMRILPLIFYSFNKPIKERVEITKQVSSITHGHIRSVISCFYYLEFAMELLFRQDKFEIYRNLQITIKKHLDSEFVKPSEILLLKKLLNENLYEFKESEFFSSGYVVHTPEASIWCILTTMNYNEALLKAVNLGENTDTTGAVTGVPAGLLYGFDNIPSEWIYHCVVTYQVCSDIPDTMA